MGRYPEDRYTGVSTDGQGNPWFLTTLAYSELCYRVAQAFSARTIERSQWTQFGDKFYSRAMSHSQNQKMSEQINRESGAMQGAYDLTWSYGAELLALQARARL